MTKLFRFAIIPLLPRAMVVAVCEVVCMWGILY
jgi:hypothetical protein